MIPAIIQAQQDLFRPGFARHGAGFLCGTYLLLQSQEKRGIYL